MFVAIDVPGDGAPRIRLLRLRRRQRLRQLSLSRSRLLPSIHAEPGGSRM